MARISWLTLLAMGSTVLMAILGADETVRAQGYDTCQWALDGECDEPVIGSGACQPGTDASDCAGVGTSTCQWADDGECDEPGIGTGACTVGTDTGDCRPISILE